MSMHTKFTPERQALVLTLLKNGALLSGAARHAGVSRQTLFNWLTSEDDKYQEFQEQVYVAQGFAQVRIEMEVYAHDPKFWLLCGPARERYDKDGTLIEGWARGPGRPPIVKTVTIPPAQAPSGEELVKAVLAAIEEAPDLRAKFLALLDKEPVAAPTSPAMAEPVQHLPTGNGLANGTTVNGVANDAHAADPVKNVKNGVAAPARPAARPGVNGAGQPTSAARGRKQPHDWPGLASIANDSGNCLALSITGP
jgi:hypothetical protein